MKQSVQQIDYNFLVMPSLYQKYGVKRYRNLSSWWPLGRKMLQARVYRLFVNGKITEDSKQKGLLL